jgi:hypothetical protein
MRFHTGAHGNSLLASSDSVRTRFIVTWTTLWRNPLAAVPGGQSQVWRLFACTLAKDTSAPLLFKGDDFGQTDGVVLMAFANVTLMRL